MAPKFEWDKGNQTKSIDKHAVSNDEAESTFNDENRLVVLSHREREIRYLCIGISNQERVLTSYFLIRNGKVRIIGTRVARKKERERYEENKNGSSSNS